MIAADLYYFGATGGSGDQRQFSQRDVKGLGERLERGLRRASIHGRRRDGDHQGVHVIATANLVPTSAGLDPDRDANGYTRRRTATTLPRMEASLPSIGS